MRYIINLIFSYKNIFSVKNLESKHSKVNKKIKKIIKKQQKQNKKQKGVATGPTCILIERLQRSVNDKKSVIWGRLQRT